MQLAAISGEAWQVSVFAGEGAAATVEDFDWIVGNCGKAKAVRKEMLDPMDAEGYTVYVLRSPENGDSEKNSGSELWPKMSASELWDIDRSSSSAYTEQALDALLHAGAIVRLIAGGAGGGPAAVLVPESEVGEVHMLSGRQLEALVLDQHVDDARDGLHAGMHEDAEVLVGANPVRDLLCRPEPEKCVGIVNQRAALCAEGRVQYPQRLLGLERSYPVENLVEGVYAAVSELE